MVARKKSEQDIINKQIAEAKAKANTSNEAKQKKTVTSDKVKESKPTKGNDPKDSKKTWNDSEANKPHVLGKELDRLEKATTLKKEEEAIKATKKKEQEKTEEAKVDGFRFAFKGDVKIHSFLANKQRLERGKHATMENPYITTDIKEAKSLEISGYFNLLK